MDEFNEEMIQNHSDKDKLLAIAAKYGPTITGKANATTADVISALESMTGAPLMRSRSTISRSACIGQSSSVRLMAKTLLRLTRTLYR